MSNRVFTLIVACILVISMAISFTSCEDNDHDIDTENMSQQTEPKMEDVYAAPETEPSNGSDIENDKSDKEDEKPIPPAEAIVDGLKYVLNDEGTYYTVYGTSDTKKEQGKLKILAEHAGLPVKEIGCEAFYSFDMTGIEIPKEITDIGELAFYNCDALTSVKLGDGVTDIGDSAFYYCKSLAEITFDGTKAEWEALNKGDGWSYNVAAVQVSCSDENVVLEAEKASEGLDIVNVFGTYYVNGIGTCTDTHIVIPSTYEGQPVTEISREAFKNSNIESIRIPYSIEAIGESAFLNCFGIKSVNISGAIKKIGNDAFCNCKNLVDVNIADGVTEVGMEVFRDCKSLEEIKLPESLNKVDNAMFINCSALKSIVIPDNYVSIEPYAFEDCTGLTSVTIGKGVKEIRLFAFNQCNSLTNITFNGTVEEWNAVEVLNVGHYSYWNYGVPTNVVHCTDGDVTVESK